jgi:hypothetical protein
MNSKVASFVLTTLTLVLTVSAYAFLVIGEPVRDNGQLAIPTTEIDIFLDSIVSSLFPGLLVAACFSRIRQPRLCYGSSLLFTLFFVSA